MRSSPPVFSQLKFALNWPFYRSFATSSISLPPHLHAHSDPHYLFKARTRWIVAELAANSRPFNRKVLSKVFQHRSIPQEHVYAWSSILSRKDLYSALVRLGLLEQAQVASPAWRREVVPCPDWLLLALPALLAQRQDASYLVGICLSPAFAALDAPNQGLFVARSLQFLIRCRHLVAAREIVEWFCQEGRKISSSGHLKPLSPSSTLKPQPALSFARCLQALTRDRTAVGSPEAPPVEFLQSLTRLLRKTMRRRKIRNSMETFAPLFSPWLLPSDPATATHLLKNVISAGFIPSQEMLHAVMKVYAANGDSERAQLLMNQIVAGEREREDGRQGDTLSKNGDLSYSQSIHEGGEMEKWETEGNGEEEDAVPAMEVDDLDVPRSYAAFDGTYIKSLTRDPIQIIENLKIARTNASLTSTGRAQRRDLDYLWVSSLDALGKSHDVSPSDMLNAMSQMERRGLRQNRPRTGPSIVSYTIILQALVRRLEFDLALSVWNRLKDSIKRPDPHLLSVIISIHIGRGDLHQAERLIRQHSPNRMSKLAPAVPTAAHLLSPMEQEDQIDLGEEEDQDMAVDLDIVPVNALLSAYNRLGHYHAAWELYRRLEGLGYKANHVTLTALVDTARYASAAAGRGYGPGVESLSSIEGASANGGRSSDIWDGSPACKVAEDIIWSLLERNWPHAEKMLEDPLQRPSKGLFALRRFTEAFGGAGEMDRPFPSTLAPDPLHSPHIYPTTRLFRSFIQLLGYHSTAKNVTRSLAWMRFLHIRPDPQTLALAVLYIEEGGPSEKSRAALRHWIRKWLGEKAVPSDSMLASMRRGSTVRM
ncbi:hypothetical protein T439DRAFT_328290 [Meredithblackwellia eburnea MCA 4105]